MSTRIVEISPDEPELRACVLSEAQELRVDGVAQGVTTLSERFSFRRQGP